MASVKLRKWTHNGKEKSAYVVRYKHDGKHCSRQFDRQKDAVAFRKTVEHEIDTGTHISRSDAKTFGFALNEFLKDCERRKRIGDGMSGNTLQSYRNQVRLNVEPKLGQLALPDVSSVTLQNHMNELSKTFRRSSLVNTAVVIRMTMKYSVAQGWLKRNPLADNPMRLPRKGRIRRAIPSKEEIGRILKALAERRKCEHACGHRTRVVAVLLALFAGMRRGEISALKWSNVDFDAGFIRVRHSFSEIDGLKSPKSEAGTRAVPMAPAVRSALTWLADMGHDPDGYVLATRTGKAVRPSHIGGHFWRPVLEIAGLINEDGSPMYGIHALRHAAVSLLIEQGLKPMHIKEIIGHASIVMTLDTYGHLFPEDDTSRLAIDAASNQFAYPLPALPLPGSPQ